jgi:hypothetical protein
VGEDEAVLIGTNLSDLGVGSPNAMAQAIIENTFEVMHQRILNALNPPAPMTGFDLLDRVVGDNFSSLVYRPIEEFKTLSQANPVAFEL